MTENKNKDSNKEIIKNIVIDEIEHFNDFLSKTIDLEKQYSNFIEQNSLLNFDKNKDGKIKLNVLKEKIVDGIFLVVDYESKSGFSLKNGSFKIFFTNEKNEYLFDNGFQIDNISKNDFDFDDIFDIFWKDFSLSNTKKLDSKTRDQIKVLIYFEHQKIVQILEVFQQMQFLKE